MRGLYFATQACFAGALLGLIGLMWTVPQPLTAVAIAGIFGLMVLTDQVTE